MAKFLQESILIAFDFIWKVLVSDRNFANLLDPPLLYCTSHNGFQNYKRHFNSSDGWEIYTQRFSVHFVKEMKSS